MDENNNLPKIEITGNSQPKASPLSSYYRQPKIYISLPSKGKYYPEGALDKSEDGKYPVYSMTAKDELMLKTPDALLSGTSTVEVIQSCVPAIKNPWMMPSIDLDAILVAIRIATYGEKMDVDTDCPNCKEEQRYEYDLTNYLDHANAFNYTEQFMHGDLVFHLRPFTYKENSKTAMTRIEQEKIYNIVNDQEMDDEEKLDRFGVSFKKITEMTVDLITSSVVKIDTPQGSEEDPVALKNFLANAPKETFDAINEQLQNMKKQLDVAVRGAKCDKCQHVFDIGITMDQADFFAARS